MGLFDRFRKRVGEVADETDGDALSVDADSEEAKAYLSQKAPPVEEEWDDVDEPVVESTVAETDDDDWDTWDDDEPLAPVALSKKERKLLERQEKEPATPLPDYIRNNPGANATFFVCACLAVLTGLSFQLAFNHWFF